MWSLKDHETNVLMFNENAWVDKVIEDQVLPIPSIADRKKLEKSGVVFKSQLPPRFKYEGNRFVAVDLPSGWKYTPEYIDRRHITLIDSQGTKVATLFVKMGGYDQSASINVL